MRCPKAGNGKAKLSVPGPWEFLLLAGAAYRVWQFAANDTILDRPRDWMVRKLGEKWDLFLLCAWCAGFWIAATWWAAWQAFPHGTLVAAVPFALSAIVGVAGVGFGRLAD